MERQNVFCISLDTFTQKKPPSACADGGSNLMEQN